MVDIQKDRAVCGLSEWVNGIFRFVRRVVVGDDFVNADVCGARILDEMEMGL